MGFHCSSSSSTSSSDDDDDDIMMTMMIILMYICQCTWYLVYSTVVLTRDAINDCKK